MGIRHLEKAIELEPSLIEYSKADSNLDNIRENPEFQQLIKGVQGLKRRGQRRINEGRDALLFFFRSLR